MIVAMGWTVALLGIVGAIIVWRTLIERTQAVARACHELRGPLTAARLGLQLGECPGGLTTERVRAIDLELGRAALALDDLGELPVRARLRRPFTPAGELSAAGQPPASEIVDAGALTADSARAWLGAAARAGTCLRVETDPRETLVRGERYRLAQATGNLLSNAIEHGEGTVTVRCRRSAGLVVIEVLDQGPGLPATVESMVRSVRRNREARGHGLAVAAEVAERAGGRLVGVSDGGLAGVALELPAADPCAGD